MTVQPGLSRTLSETPKTGYLRTRLKLLNEFTLMLLYGVHDVETVSNECNKLISFVQIKICMFVFYVSKYVCVLIDQIKMFKPNPC